MKEEKNILEGGNIIVEAMMLKVLSVFKEWGGELIFLGMY